jgi:large subunit ribosomal protein L25
VTDVLNVVKRSETGTKRNNRLRDSGKIPAVLYGHKMEAVNLVLDGKELDAVMKHSGHFVSLDGDVKDSALIKEIQFDHFEQRVLHIDLFRVSMDEKVEVEVSLSFKGTAPGTTEGGVLETVLHSLKILCPAVSIPDTLAVRIGELRLNGVIRASDVELPQGASLVTPAEAMVVHCVLPMVEATPDAAATPAEPELVGRKDKKESEGAE